jgi:hypothetical protein
VSAHWCLMFLAGLAQGTLLGFAIAVSIGIVASATKLLPGAHARAPRPAVAKAASSWWR